MCAAVRQHRDVDIDEGQASFRNAGRAGESKGLLSMAQGPIAVPDSHGHSPKM